MEAFLIDCRGEACPLPVVKTKKALAEQTAVCTLVDNEIAVQNLQKMAAHLGYTAAVEPKEQDFAVTIAKAAGAQPVQPLVLENCCAAEPTGETVVVLSGGQMGQGDEKLGSILIKSFVFALTQLDKLPDTILLYNGGVFLSCQGSACLEDLQALEREGCRILTCGTCLDYYGLKDRLAVGSVSNMYEIVSILTSAGRVVRP